MPDKNTIGANIMRLLAENRQARNGLPQNRFRLAKASKMGWDVIHAIVEGRRQPTIVTLRRLADALKVEPGELLTEQAGA